MAASKRNLDDFHNFPGRVIDNIYEFPLLKKTDTMDRTRQWQIFIRLVRDGHRQTGIDWDLDDEKTVPILNEYFDGRDLPDNVIAQLYSENGIVGGKITRNAPTYFTEIALEGRANQRNQFQQALIKGRADHIKRSELGGNKKTNDKMYFPMLAKPWKDAAKHIVYPVFVQPKLDGVRCISYITGKDGDVVFYSRTKKIFPRLEYLANILRHLLVSLYDDENNQSIYLDGELYRHGDNLQDISGRSRRENKETKNKNEYHLYDCFYPTEMDTPFVDRYLQLEELFSAVDRKSSKYLKLVQTNEAKNKNEVNKLYDKHLKNGYEGVILRNKHGEYKANAKSKSSGQRSNDLIKMKPKFTDEYKIIGYTSGKRGKDANAIIWICETKEGNQFNVTPKDITYEERESLFAEAEKNFEQFRGKMLTVEYEDLSNDNIPQRAKALVIRDYE